ncbi:hypothetical protein B566_EDAN002589 [Ephemera danica]|nr:hypothetical protein B566_EDAN002589 [Ephemera danica]
MEPGIVVSPVAKDPAEVPNVSLTDYVLENLRKNLSAYSNKPWVVDVLTGCQIKFGDLEEQTRHVASALVRLGFKHGDVLYYVTYESASLLVVLLAAWRLGGAVRGSYQDETPETRSRLVLVDVETSTRVQEALSLLDWSITLLCLDDNVSDAIPYSKLLQDDGSAFPDKVNKPSGRRAKDKVQPISQFSLGGTFSVSYLYCSLASLFSGATIYFLSKFRKEDFLGHLVQHKPMQVTMYPYVASWFARNPEMSKYDLSFIRLIILGGSVVDPATIVDQDTGKTLSFNERGEIVVRAPYVMKGYITSLAKASGANLIKDDGWYHTGDIGFFDEENIFYVRGRLSQVFKYFMHFSAGVVGVINPETTSLARAYVVLRLGHNVTAHELQTYVAVRLPTHKHLHGGLFFLDQLPMNRGGKLDRIALQKLAAISDSYS